MMWFSSLFDYLVWYKISLRKTTVLLLVHSRDIQQICQKKLMSNVNVVVVSSVPKSLDFI